VKRNRTEWFSARRWDVLAQKCENIPNTNFFNYKPVGNCTNYLSVNNIISFILGWKNEYKIQSDEYKLQYVVIFPFIFYYCD